MFEAAALALLAEAGRVLGESLDLSATFAGVARLCVSGLAEVAIFDLVDGGTRRVAVAVANPELAALADELRGYPPRDWKTHPLAAAVRAGRSVTVEVDDAMLQSVAHDQRHLTILRSLPIASMLEAPLLVRGHALGVLSLSRGQRGGWTPDDVLLAGEVARRAAVAVDNARLFEAEQRARQRAEEARQRTLRLLSVTEGLEGALEPRQVATVILQRGLVPADAAGAAVMLIEPGANMIQALAWAGYDEAVMKGPLWRIPLDLPVPIAHAARTGETVLLSNREEWASRFTITPIAASQHNSWATIPLSIAGRRIGALGVSYANERVFTTEDREILQGLASQCAQALQRAQLFSAEHAARAAAEAAVRAREEFLSIASHELRTPLTPLTLQLGVLRKNAPAELSPGIETAQRQTERLIRLVSNLLDVSRLGLGTLQLDRAPMDLWPLVQALPERFSYESRRQGCPISVEGGPLEGSWDGPRIEQVFANLVSNAVKYGSGRPVQVKLWRDGETACFSVADQGIGIAAGDQERIFGRFERAVSAQQFGGLGLGLYISREIVAAHGGRISVQSEPGKGATFVVALPLS